MSRSPNSEQKLAIEHQGGVLLRAGAGSGKTFVLVEHIVHLTQLWIAEFQGKPLGNLDEFLREKFSQVVMMTFTKKAAGEMNIRLAERFAELMQADDPLSHWKIANDNLPLLTVTTIDGFCLKLITGGYLPHLSTEAKVIFYPERKDQVEGLVETWLQQHLSSLKTDIAEILIREKDVLLEAFCNVFNDPGLRLTWKNFSSEDSHPSRLDELVSRSYHLNNVGHAIAQIHGLDLPEEKERSAFEKSIAELQACGMPEVNSLETMRVYFAQLAGKTLRGEATAKKKCPAYDEANAARKILKDWVCDWLPELDTYLQHYQDKILPWVSTCRDIFDYVDQRLDPNQGMTFGDIEYLVANGLKLPEVAGRVQKAFHYFIVDEFQDTSALQFSIIRSLIGENFNKLFCVGDAKQAIYGFRGGELSVFQDCGELVPVTRTLANNYRSLPEIIQFNNSLFRTVLPLGQGFEGIDAFTVQPEDQQVPPELNAPINGSIEILEAALNWDAEGDKLKNEHINRLEAELIAASIKSEREKNPDQVCTVLYGKLKPSADLIRILMERNIGFTAQFKTDLLDDPIMGIFLCLLRRIFDVNPETKDRFPLFLMNSYFSALRISQLPKEEQLQKFERDVAFWGLSEAYRKFLFSLGITNENYDINLDVIETLVKLHHEDPEAVMSQIARGDNDRISLDLRYGDQSHMVQIMTAHASKGLEFDTVYLGGVYTNGREIADGSLFGNMPGSFKWYLDLSQRDKKSSPFYLYEKELGAYKSFSESKRLFYVACTRAKKQLKWVSLKLPEKSFSIPANSWIDGLNHWYERVATVNALAGVRVTQLPEIDANTLLKGDQQPRLPLFFHDSMGIHQKLPAPCELGIAAELSVTRLNSLVQCPRKFYLENVLKLSGENDQVEFEEPEAVASEDELTMKRSSAERGTRIHARISEAIAHNFVIPRESFATDEHASLAWILDELKPLAMDYHFVSEQPIKFKLFNFMVSGIPDLVLLPRSAGSAQIWDFKTGKSSPQKNSLYWVQLKAYASALFELGMVENSSELELKLAFVDEKKTYSLRVSRQNCQTDLFTIWQSQNDPSKVNLDHCTQCPYGDICPR